MSDSYIPDPPELVDNEEYQRAKMRGFLSGLQMLPGALTLAVPGKDTGIPGVATGAYAGLGGFVPDAISWAGRKLGYNLNIPHAPGADAAAQEFASSNERANTILPVRKLAPAESESEQIMQDAIQAFGGAAVPMPGAVLARLPMLGKIAASTVLPPARAAIPMAAASAGLTAGVESAQAAQSDKVATTLDSAISGEPQDQIKATQPPTAPPLTAQTQAAPPASVSDQLNAAVSGSAPPPPAPTFGEQGESGITTANVFEGLAALGGALVAGRYLHAWGGRLTQAARDARVAAPEYVSKTADFVNNQIAAQGSEITKPVQAPLVTSGQPIHDVAVAAKNNVLDETAHLQDYIKITGNNPATSTRLAHQAGMIENDMAWQPTMRAFYDTGVDFKTKMSMPSPTQWFDDVARLSDPDKEKLNSALLAANEMDNRKLLQQQGKTPSRYDFPNQSDQDLARTIVNTQRDPVMRDLMDRYSMMGQRMIDIGEARGFFTPQEANQIKTAHPNHVADVDDQGRILHALGPRPVVPEGGVRQANTTAWSALAQHMEALYRQYELNDFRVALADHQLDFQSRQPTSAEVMQRINLPTQPHTYYAAVQPTGSNVREPVITIRRPTGPEHYRVYNNNMHNWLAASNATKLRAFMDAASAPRRWLQTGTTGVLSLASGRAFPLVNAARTLFQAPINRPKGYAGGLLDLGMQRMTGGRLGYRGLDPTNIIGGGYANARSAVDDLALHLSHAFDKSNPNMSTQILKSLLTPGQMDQISKGLHNFYTNTTTYEMRAGGVGGQGTPFKTNLPAFHTATGESLRPTRLMASQVSPKLFLSGGKTGAIKPAWINLRRAAEDMFSSLSDAGHEYFYRLNRAAGVDRTSLAYETRQLTGDPGTRGAGRAAEVVSGTVPYANISAQGGARFGRAINESPIGTSAALVGSLGTAALLSIYTAMNHGQDAVDYLQNVLTTQGRAANVTLFKGAGPAEANWQFSLPQELRPVYAIMLDLVGKAFNLKAAMHDNDVHDGLLGFLKDWFSEHIENSTWESALHGVADTLNILDVPPVSNAISAVTGTHVRIDLERIVNDLRTGQFGLSHTFTMPAGTDRPLPNQPPGDNGIAGADSRKYVDIATHLFGLVGGVLDDLTGFNKYYHQTNDWWLSMGQVGKDWLQHAMDLNPMLNNVLWENQARNSVRPPIVESVQRQLDAMKVTQGYASALKFEGTTGGGVHALPVPGQSSEGRVPTDPHMLAMYADVARTYSFIQGQPMADINALRKQLDATNNQAMNKQQQREFANEQTRKIADKYRYIQATIDDENAKLSRLVGAPVDVSSIDWSKGPEQFTAGH